MNALHLRDDGSGIWEGFIADVTAGANYKYRIVSREGKIAEKGDPFAHYWEIPPLTASRVWALDYAWNDAVWMTQRSEKNRLNAPCSIYEVHLGSWRRVPEDGNRSFSYREMAELLPHYLVKMNFTHVEFMPLTEHPFYGSWDYETTGFFAPTARYGMPQDFMFLVDTLHQQGIGVILDWVPGDSTRRRIVGNVGIAARITGPVPAGKGALRGALRTQQPTQLGGHSATRHFDVTAPAI